jgi:energy-coupling factor transport system substrate-specific component
LIFLYFYFNYKIIIVRVWKSIHNSEYEKNLKWGYEMKSGKTAILTFGALCIALNVVLGTVVSWLKIPLLFLDTIGTVLMAVLFGPWWGALVGGLTNIVLGITTGPTAIFFGLVNIAIALVVGLVAWKFDFMKWHIALITGVLLAVIAPLIGTPIAVGVFGGLNGSGMDFVVLWMRAAGESIFASTFISRITGNFVDKIVTCMAVCFIVASLPQFAKTYRRNKDHAA